MRRIIFLTSAIFLMLTASGADKIKYGKISKEEINLKLCEYDEEAEAVVLSYTGEIKVNANNVVINRHIRIKVLKENGIKYANVSIPFYAKEGYEKFYSIKAQTINGNSSDHLEYSEVNKSHVFEADLSENYKEKRFTFANVKVGSILEYEYSIISENHLYLDSWRFQNELPTLRSSLRVEVPDYLDYHFLLQGNRLVSKYKEKETNEWELENLPALKEEPFLYNLVDFVEMIQFQLSGYYARSSYGGGAEYQSLRKTWESLADEVLNSYEYKAYLNRSGFAKNILNQLPLTGLSQREKIRTIYDYVINNYSWNGKYRRFTYNKFTEFKANSDAYSSELNLLLVLLLNEAGIEAHPMLISTRSNGVYVKDYPFLMQFNHLIAYARAEEKEYFLDALDPLRPYDVLPEEDHISEGFILDKKDPRWVKISANKVAMEMCQAVMCMKEDGSLDAQITWESNGLSAVKHRRQILKGNSNKWFSGLFVNAELRDDSVMVKNVEDINNSLSAKAKLTFNGSLASGHGTFYLSPFAVKEFSTNPFNSDKRSFPVQFPYKRSLRYVCTITLPDKYEVNELPKSEKIVLPNNYGEFTYWITATGNLINLQIIYGINEVEIPAIQYPNLKEFYGILISKVNQQIVVSRKK